MPAMKISRSPAELYKIHNALHNAMQWLVAAHSLSGDDDGAHIEAAQASVQKAMDSLQKQHNVAC